MQNSTRLSGPSLFAFHKAGRILPMDVWSVFCGLDGCGWMAGLYLGQRDFACLYLLLILIMAGILYNGIGSF